MRCSTWMVGLVLAAVLWQAPTPLRVPNGETRTIEAPAVAVPARLVFRVRADYWRPAGSNPLLRITVGGRPVGRMRDRLTPRLADRAERADGLPPFDFGRWRVRQGPGPGDELALDVSDLLPPDRPTLLAFECAASGALGATPLVIEDLRLEAGGSGAPASPVPDGRTPRLALPAAPRFEVEADRDRIDVRWEGERIAIETVVAGGAHERVRRVERLPDRIEVHDTIRNTGGTLVGLDVHHSMPAATRRAYLGGRLDPDYDSAYSPWNPTVFMPVGTSGLGLVAEDDVFRQQLHVDFDVTGRLGLDTFTLCLPPGERQTLVWSVYPVRTPSYWDFINRVRANWKVNRTVEGSFVWFTPDAILAMPPARLRDALARQGTAIASMYGGWIDPTRDEKPPFIGFGTAVLREEFAEYRGRIAKAIRRLKEARPGLEVLLYFDAQRDSSPDADRHFADSVLLDADGRPERVDWNARFSFAWGMVPTADNSFGKAMRDVARAMRALGADGLYWDEMDGVDFREPRATFGRPDGRACFRDDILVPIPVGLANLLSEAVKLEYADLGGRVLGNVPPTTRAFTERPDLRMVEAQGDHAPWGPMAHLTTPLAFVGERGDFATARAKIDEGLLPVTAGLDVAHDLTARLFPFTPEYLQPGTLRGRERIVTTESGTHGWRDCPGEVRAFRYDADGREELHPLGPEGPSGWRMKRRHGGAYVRVALEPGEAAIVECARSVH